MARMNHAPSRSPKSLEDKPNATRMHKGQSAPQSLAANRHTKREQQRTHQSRVAQLCGKPVGRSANWRALARALSSDLKSHFLPIRDGIPSRGPWIAAPPKEDIKQP